MLGSESDHPAQLKRIDPSRLVGEGQDDFEDFFLSLAIIYNDLKGLEHIKRDFIEDHQPPSATSPSAYSGEYNGMTTQLYKLIVAHMHEFFEFIRSHENIYSDPRFPVMLYRLTSEQKLAWKEIVDVTFRRTVERKRGEFAHRLMLIRNNVAFHYDQSDKVLREAFRDFFTDETQANADYAYYSVGKNMETTRFYYADAAVQRYLMKTASEQGEVDFASDLAKFQDFQAESFKVINTMNRVLSALLRQFIKTRHETRTRR